MAKSGYLKEKIEIMNYVHSYLANGKYDSEEILIILKYVKKMVNTIMKLERQEREQIKNISP